MMGNSIGVKFTLTPAEYSSAIRQHMLRQPASILVGVVATIVIMSPFCVLILEKLTGAELLVDAGSIVAAVVAAVVVLFLFVVAPKRAYGKLNPANRDQEQAFRFSEEGIESRCATAEGKLDWKTWVKFKETGQFFLIYPSHQMFHLLPKRAFGAPQEMDAFRELLKRKLSPT